jgi:hypothetical protein
MSWKLEISSRIGCPGRSCRVASNGYFQLLVLFIAFVVTNSTQNAICPVCWNWLASSPCFLTCKKTQAGRYLPRKRRNAKGGKTGYVLSPKEGGRKVACCLCLQTSMVDWRNLSFGIPTELYESYAANASLTNNNEFLLFTKRWSFLLN